MQIEAKNPNGQLTILNVDSNGNLKVSHDHAKYQLQTLQGNVFTVGNQAARAWTVALATTYTGLVVSNPVGNNKNLVILKVGFALSVAPAAIASIGLFQGFSAASDVTHTIALTPNNALVGSSTVSTAKADESATLTGTPVWNTQFMGGFTAAALPATSPSILDIDGAIIVQPGGYLGIGALTAVTGFGSIMYQEINR